MAAQRMGTLGSMSLLGALVIAALSPATEPELGQPSGFTAGSPYSFRPLDPYWSYRAMPTPPPRFEALGAQPIFMTSLHFPGVYGAYVFGVTPTGYLSRTRDFAPIAPSSELTTLTTLSATSPLAANPRTALIDVLVPSGGAELTFDNTPTAPTGLKREFVTPPLVAGGTYVYNVRVTWNDDGTRRSRDKNVYVRAGERLVVDLATTSGTYEGPSLRVQPGPDSGSTLRTRPMP